MITAYIHCAYTCAHVDTGHAGLAAGSARNDSEQGGPFGKQTLCNWAVTNQKCVCFPDSDGVTTDDEHPYQSTTWAWVKFRTIQARQILVSLSCFGGPNLEPIPALCWGGCALSHSWRGVWVQDGNLRRMLDVHWVLPCPECFKSASPVRLSHMSKNHQKGVNLKQISNEISKTNQGHKYIYKYNIPNRYADSPILCLMDLCRIESTLNEPRLSSCLRAKTGNEPLKPHELCYVGL